MPSTAFSPFRVAGTAPVRPRFAMAAGICGLLSALLVLSVSYVLSSFIPGLPWYEPCGLQAVVLIVPFAALPLLGTAQRLLADRAHLVGPFGPYGIYSVPLVLIVAFLGGFVSTAVTLLWSLYGFGLSLNVIAHAAYAPSTQGERTGP